MAASKAQGQGLTLFMIGITAGAAGIAEFSEGLGKLSLLVGAVLVAISCWQFLKLKPLEGKIALNPQPPVMKLAGVLVALAGWVVALLGIHFTTSVGGRGAIAIVGLLISLFGVIGILPVACNKNAIWKT